LICVRYRVALCVLCCASSVGCGGPVSSVRKSRSTAVARASQGEQPRSPGTGKRDDLAFVEIARASGTLRTNVAAAALGRARRIANLPAIAAAAQTLREVRPRDRGLTALRGRMRAALEAALAAHPDPRSQHAAAIAALKATDAVNGQLRRYASRHPEVQALIPD
jgi:hypothetical protein